MLRNRAGIALITVSMIMIFMLIIAAVSLKLLMRSADVSGSSRRYLSVFDAAESGVEMGMLKIETAAALGFTTPSDTSIDIGTRDVDISIEHIFTGTVSGANITFGGTGYEGVGTGISSGGSASYYRILSEAAGTVQEQSTIETAYRKIIGINVR